MNVEKINTTISQRYEKIRDMGSGGGGRVSLVKDKQENREAVMKASLSNDLSCGIPMEFIREVKFFKELGPANHPNILQMYNCFIENNRVHIILERCKDDLLSLIRDKDVPLSVGDIKAIMYDVLSPLKFCHSRFIAHRDIKPENYLIGLNKRLRLSDFGLSRYVGTARNQYTTGNRIQTIFYRAPEILVGARCYSTALDMWSVGCILGSLILRAPLFLGQNNYEILHAIFYLLGTPTEETWPDMNSYPILVKFEKQYPRKNPSQLFDNAPEDMLDLLYRMLDYNPNTRITAEQALEHPFFTNDPPMTPFEDLPYWQDLYVCYKQMKHTTQPFSS